jgi:acyl-coenzyme A synthetase/AMP-(fatty) acid ligase
MKKYNLCRHLVAASNLSPNKLAVSVQKKTINGLTYQELTFAQLHQQSDDIAFALNKFGLKKGTKAVLMVTPSIAFFNLTFALFKAGIIPILVDPGMGVKNLKQCFEEAQPNAFIGIPKAHLARGLFSWGKKTIKQIITVNGPALFGGTQLSTLLKSYPRTEPYPIQQLDKHELAAILFTSGSTGIPKGVVYSHSMFEAQINVLKKEYHIQPGEADLATFPLFSLFGPALGMAAIVPEMNASKPIKANPDYLFAAIEKYQCTNLFVNPALLDVLAQAGEQKKHTLPSLKRVISAGAPASLHSINIFSRMLRKETEVINSYGATESLPISKIGSQELLKTTHITEQGGGICVGYPVKNISIKIIKTTDAVIKKWQDNLALSAFEIGEIIVKGPQVSRAYYHRQKATEQAKIQDGSTVIHRMGDLGYLDEHGKLWMCGRKAHQVQSSHLVEHKVYHSIPCERIFNTHKSIKRSALIGVTLNKKIMPALCIEVNNDNKLKEPELFTELSELAALHDQTQGIDLFFIHSSFPMDIRHNAKIFREKLALWAQQKIDKN